MGQSQPRENEPGPAGLSPDDIERAERLVNQLGEFTSGLGHRLLRELALAREEMEDIWAEAQAVNREPKA